MTEIKIPENETGLNAYRVTFYTITEKKGLFGKKFNLYQAYFKDVLAKNGDDVKKMLGLEALSPEKDFGKGPDAISIIQIGKNLEFNKENLETILKK